MELNEALKLARSGRALLFVGAGFSVGTKNARGERMQTASGFSDRIGLAVNLPAGTGLMDTSEAYLEEFGAEALVGELVEEFDAQELLPHHLAIAAVPWKQIYTTNYDNILEKSFQRLKLRLETINPDATVAGIPKDVPVCIHLNGSIIGITPDKLANQIKLTDSSYLTSSIADSEWSVRFRQDVDAAQAIFYLGYSTYDLDIARLLMVKPPLKSKSFFMVGTSVDSLLARRIEKFGVNTGLTAAEFSTEVSKDEYAPVGVTGPAEYCLRAYMAPTITQAFTDEDVFSLFRLGRVSPALIFESLTGAIQYAVPRATLDKLMGIINEGPSASVVHSGLGNGKSILLEMLKVEAFVAGFTVIELLRQADSLFEELEFALKRPGRLLFIVDNYGNWLDALKFIGMHHAKNISVVLAARTNTHDVLAGRLSDLMKIEDLNEIVVDRVPPVDIVKIVRLMDTYGLWGEKSGWSLERKQRFLSASCSGAWHAILLSLFKAPQIKDRLDKLVADIRGEKTYNLILVAIMVLAIIDYPATTDNLTDLCGERTLTVGFRQNPTIRELIDFDSDEVRLKSSVTGAFLLRSVADPESTLASLISITEAADRAAFASHEYFAMLVSLVRFGNAQNFFPENDRSKTVIRYYEAIKELAHCKRNPLFWLQYAIACLFLEEFERAGTYFESAYSFAASSNFRTFQIDNHYARYLLRKSVRDENPVVAMGDFKRARKLIYEQIRRERLHYPYRVAALIGEWFDALSDRLSLTDKAEVKRTAVFICSRIAQLPEARQKHKDVADCYRKLQTIVQEN